MQLTSKSLPKIFKLPKIILQKNSHENSKKEWPAPKNYLKKKEKMKKMNLDFMT